MYRALAAFVLWAMAGLCFAQTNALYNVRDYGAVGDGVALDTAALNKTIEACAKAGGGTVYVPAGTYLTGTVNLKSNMTLWIASGATLLGSKNLADYPVPEPWAKESIDFGYGVISGTQWYKALVRGDNLENITILGPGTIDGNSVFNPDGEERMRGPHAVSLEQCRNVTVRDLAIRNSSNWALRLRSCEQVNIDGYSATGGWDGINMEATTDVTISNCRLFTGDDSVAGSAKNLTLTNCLLSSSANAFRYSGENTVISNVLILAPGREEHRTSRKHNTESGFQGSPTGNLVMSNISMINVRSPFWLDFRGERAASLRMTINNVTATGVGKTPFVVIGDPAHPVKSLILNDVRMVFTGGVEEGQTNAQGMSPYSILPWYGLYSRYVENLEFHNVRFGFEEKDQRPALFGEDIGNLELDRFVAQRGAGGAPSIMLYKVERLLMDGKEETPRKVQIKGLEVDAGKIIAGEPFPVTVTVQNDGPEGLGEFSLQVGKETQVRSVWLKAGERAQVRFANMISTEAGEQQAQAGEFSRKFTVLPKPIGHPVRGPYLAYQNTEAQVQQLDEDGFYIRAAGDPAQCCLYRADTYGVVYLKEALPLNGSVVTRLENADQHSWWAGEMGIMVRNDISKAGQSTGYLVFTASPSSGYFLQWDSKGDDRVDKHTEMDGYTYWPHWLKLQRRGNRFTGYYSADGSNWIKVGEVELPEANEHLDAGIFTHLSSARFEGFKVIAEPGQK